MTKSDMHIRMIAQMTATRLCIHSCMHITALTGGRSLCIVQHVTAGTMYASFIMNIYIINLKFFSSKQITNPIRSDGLEDHLIKKIGTPTMGGVLILIGLFLAFLTSKIEPVLSS